MVTSGNQVGSIRDWGHSLVYDSVIHSTDIYFSLIYNLDIILDTGNTAVSKTGMFPTLQVIYIIVEEKNNKHEHKYINRAIAWGCELMQWQESYFGQGGYKRLCSGSALQWNPARLRGTGFAESWGLAFQAVTAGAMTYNGVLDCGRDWESVRLEQTMCVCEMSLEHRQEAGHICILWMQW